MRTLQDSELNEYGRNAHARAKQLARQEVARQQDKAVHEMMDRLDPASRDILRLVLADIATLNGGVPGSDMVPDAPVLIERSLANLKRLIGQCPVGLAQDSTSKSDSVQFLRLVRLCKKNLTSKRLLMRKIAADSKGERKCQN